MFYCLFTGLLLLLKESAATGLYDDDLRAIEFFKQIIQKRKAAFAVLQSVSGSGIHWKV